MFKEFVYPLVGYFVSFSIGWPASYSESAGGQPGPINDSSPKSIAIVGAGSAGLAALKTLLDLPATVRQSWDIVLYEQRRDVGGVWLPDLNAPSPPKLPETPLYPALRTNTPGPSMTYPKFPYREMTPLYPNHKYVWEYHRDFADHYNLTDSIRLNTTVLSSAWVGNFTQGYWNVTVREPSGLRTDHLFDHLIVANGHNHYPNIPTWPGQDRWITSSEKNRPKREILHSIFWRNASKYEGKNVLVVGAGASGSDAVLHTAPVAAKVFLSLKEDKPSPSRVPASYYTRVSQVSHFTASSVVLADGSALQSVDAIILATGYEYRVPFLSAGDVLTVDRTADSCPERALTLTTNLRYVFPLHEHIFSLAAAYPTNALAFVGLPMQIANCPSDIAQAMLIAHAIADPNLLPSREEMLVELRNKEGKMRAHGLDPYNVGHRMVSIGSDGKVDSAAQDYQDQLVSFLRQHQAIPEDGHPFVEHWRRWVQKEGSVLWSAWKHVEALGDQAIEAWLRSIETETDWVQLMKRLARWELDQSVTKAST